MSLLTPEELEQLAGAETLFRSPIPVQSLSSDEFMSGRKARSSASSRRASSTSARGYGPVKRAILGETATAATGPISLAATS